MWLVSLVVLYFASVFFAMTTIVYSMQVRYLTFVE